MPRQAIRDSEGNVTVWYGRDDDVEPTESGHKIARVPDEWRRPRRQPPTEATAMPRTLAEFEVWLSSREEVNAGSS